MTQPPTVLILGARSRFGLAATRAFAQAGWRVVAQLRPGASGPVIPGVVWLAAQPGDTALLASAAHGAAVVVQGLSPVYTHRAWRRNLPWLTQAAIDVTRELGALLMLPASVYNFGESMPPLLREDTAQAASTFKGRMRIASEAQVRAATQDGRMKAVVIRGGDFFGSGTGSWLDEVMVKDLRRGRFTYPGPMNVPTAWAWLPDMARSFVAVAGQRHRLPAFEPALCRLQPHGAGLERCVGRHRVGARLAARWRPAAYSIAVLADDADAGPGHAENRGVV